MVCTMHASVYLDDVEVVYARSIILNLCSQRYTYTVVHEGHTSTYKKVVLQLYMVISRILQLYLHGLAQMFYPLKLA